MPASERAIFNSRERRRRSFLLNKKRRYLIDISEKTNYDFLRQHYLHQVKGSKLITSSQPATTSSPVFFILSLTHVTVNHVYRLS